VCRRPGAIAIRPLNGQDISAAPLRRAAIPQANQTKENAVGFYENLQTFAGKRVVDFEDGGELADPQATVPRVRIDYDSGTSVVELLTQVIQSPRADQLTGLVIGAWFGDASDADSSAIVETLVAAAEKLANLRGIFFGDVTSEENEVSWIYQSDVSGLWDAFPRLETFCIRGSNGLSLGKMRHNHLRQLTIECGGLPKSVLAEVAAASLPALEHLELYLGTENYGWDGTIEDVRPLLAANRFPHLKYLGLRDAEIADDVAKAVAQSPVIGQVEVLDLSLGTLTDEGAQALVDSPAVRKLKRLDLHFHYLSEEMASKLQGLGIDVDLSEPQEPDEDYRYVSVGE
jgi:hypothetical protein